MSTCPSCSTSVSDRGAVLRGLRGRPRSGDRLAPAGTGRRAADDEPAATAGGAEPLADRGHRRRRSPWRPVCAACGGAVAEDGYCGTCGARAAGPRDHVVEQPASWVAAVCDRGIRHPRNEDAVAVAADPEPGTRAVLVVCDGVSSSIDSDVASLAGARAARNVLATSPRTGWAPPPPGSP